VNIKSNIKSNIKGKSLIRTKSYIIPTTVTFLIGCFIWLLDGSWGVYLTFLIIGIITHFIYVGINEHSRYNHDLHWDNEAYYNWFAIVGLPMILIGIFYPFAISPAIHDYYHAERIDEEIPIDKNISLMYNDYHSTFILMVEGEKQPLLIDKGGSSDTYNRMKASYLDKKIKVVKKRYKSWTDDEIQTVYQLDGYTFK